MRKGDKTRKIYVGSKVRTRDGVVHTVREIHVCRNRCRCGRSVTCCDLVSNRHGVLKISGHGNLFAYLDEIEPVDGK